jgi:hypothetical protein
MMRILLLASPLATPQAFAQEVDVSALGPQVGERLPEFDLRDQAGRSHTRSSIMGPNGAIVVLSRSADW